MITAMNGKFPREVYAWYEERLEHFPGEQVRKSETDTDALCPAHPDTHPSLGIDLRRNGAGPRIVLKCRSQECAFQDILTAAGLTADDLVYAENGAGAAGCTLEMYSQHKRLPLDFLQGEGVSLRDVEHWGRDAIEIPYFGEHGEYLLSRFRVALTGRTKVVSRKGEKTTIYGQHLLPEAREKGYTLLSEGESCCHSSWYRGWPCLGIPGASTWKPEWDRLLEGIPRLLFVVETDQASEGLFRKMQRREALAPRLRRLG
jgi:putative DNA primase/helicase